MAFTEFYCNASTGSNMNGGSDENTSPSYTATNGGWNSGTGVFTPTSGDPSASVTVGQFAHVFTDGSTTPAFIGRVTAVNSTTVTVSTTAKSGTAPGTAGSGVSINVGGVWKGPNGTVNFPFGFAAGAMTNSSGNQPRINLKNNATYSITAELLNSHSGGSQVSYEGYSSTAGDLGRAVIDGGTSGASYNLLRVETNCGMTSYRYLIFQNNGATGSTRGVHVGGSTSAVSFVGCVVNSIRGSGWNLAGNNFQLIECEAYSCNQSNTANLGGFVGTSGGTLTRCIAHDNTGSNSIGFYFTPSNLLKMSGCIADSNGGIGIRIGSGWSCIESCDSYNNGSHGMSIEDELRALLIENCNFIKNGGYGINGSITVTLSGDVRIYNCGFGAGTQANTSGTTTGVGHAVVTGTVTYASDVTPWVDPANGDFRISLAAAKNAGRGTFTETASSYSGTVGYPDIGAAQHQDSGATPYVIGS